LAKSAGLKTRSIVTRIDQRDVSRGGSATLGVYADEEK